MYLEVRAITYTEYAFAIATAPCRMLSIGSGSGGTKLCFHKGVDRRGYLRFAFWPMAIHSTSSTLLFASGALSRKTRPVALVVVFETRCAVY